MQTKIRILTNADFCLVGTGGFVTTHQAAHWHTREMRHTQRMRLCDPRVRAPLTILFHQQKDQTQLRALLAEKL